MADTRDFLPEAGPPWAEKSQMKNTFYRMEQLKTTAGAYVILGSENTYMYKGCARDLRKRVSDHVLGRVARTRNRRPLNVLHVEYTSNYTEARRRENWLKSGQGRKWLKDKYAWVVEWQTQGT
jgi:putative endonuclease